MAMAERPRPGWASYQNPNTNNCQDMGNSILLLLGLVICINIGINLVTLVRDGGCGWVAGRQAWSQGPTCGHHVLLYLALEPTPNHLTPNVPYHL